MASKEEHFGDILLFKSDTLEGKIVSSFTGEEFNHCGIRISEGWAYSVGIFGEEYHNLNQDWNIYGAKILLKHDELTPKQREDMKSKHVFTRNVYDYFSVPLLAWRLIHGMRDTKDISFFGEKCTSYPVKLYNHVGITPFPDIHPSQVIPSDFYYNKKFRVIGYSGC